MRKISATIVAVFATLQCFAALTAENVLDKVSAVLTRPQSVSVTFSFTGNGGNGSGTMTVCKEKFSYNAGDIVVWYNGKYQWTLQRSAGEVSLTEPTAAELIESNPFQVVSGFRNNFTCKMLPAPKGQYKVSLTSKSKAAAIKSAVITVNAKTFVPISLKADMSGNTSTTVNVKSFTKGSTLPKSYFEFDAKMNKNVELIDLR